MRRCPDNGFKAEYIYSCAQMQLLFAELPELCSCRAKPPVPNISAKR